MVSLVLVSFIALSVYTYTRADERARVHAAVPATLNFQARLQSSSGGVVPDGTYSVAFNMYNVSSGGISQWNETQNVTVKNGYFSVYLGDVNSLTGLDWSLQYWLTLNVAGDGEMSPRIRMTSVPYAFRAGQADLLTNGSGTLGANNIAQLSPSSIQAVNTALAALRINQTGAGGLLQLQGDGGDVLTLDKQGNLVIDGTTQINAGSALEQLTVGGAINIGTTTNSNAGNIRWTGTDFEGYDGVSWLSFTDDYTGTPTININKVNTEPLTTTIVLQPDNELTFTIEANETWTYRFVVQANSPAAADIQFSVSAPAGATCVNSAINAEDTVTVANLGCGVTTGQLNTAGTADTYEITGTVVNGANAGSITLNWAQFGSSGTTNVYAGSYVTAMRVNGTVSGLEFMTGGNSFGALAELGTNDNFGLDIQTNGTTRISIADSGEVTLNTLTDATAGLVISGGDLDLSGTESILNIGSNLTGAGALTIASGGISDLVLDSASGILVLQDAILQRSAVGTTTIDLLDASDTTLSLVNSNGGAELNLNVEGLVTAADFAGDGGGLTGLDASNISLGNLADGRLSANVALLNANQTFTGLPTFDEGLILGSSTSTTAGALRWSGTDFEGYDGIQWVALSGGGGGGGSSSPALVSVTKPSNETVNNSTTLQDDDDLEFAIGANEIWTFRFVVQANTSAVADLKFAVSAPSGATCNVGFIDEQGSVSQSGVGCGTASATISGTGANEVYEIIGTINNGATPGNVTLRWAQDTLEVSNTTLLTGSFVQAAIEGGGLQFMQGGNAFGSAAILGTTDNNSLNFITNNATALTLEADGDAVFSGLAYLNNGVDISGGAIIDGGATIDGAAINLNVNSNFATNINSGTSNGTITIGGGNAPLVIDSTNFDVSSGGGLSGITGFTQSSGNFAVNGTGSFSTGTGLVSLNGATTVSTITNGANTVTINGTTGTAAAALVIAQTGDAENIVMTNDARTNGALISLTQSTSTYTGTGLLLNFASGSGSFNSGNFADFQINGTSRFRVDSTGALTISSDSTSALKISSTGGIQYFNVDVSGNQVVVGNSDTLGVQFVLDTKTNAGDPVTGINGGMYYNSSANKFRCFENNEWEDCSPGAVNMSIVSGLDTSAAATNLAAATLNCVSDPSLRSMVNFSNVNKLRWIGKIGGTINAATKMRLQYHTGGNIAVATGDAGWTTLDTSAGGHTLSTYFYVNEITLPTAAQTNNLVIRACLFDGNGAADPTITGVQLNAYR